MVCDFSSLTSLYRPISVSTTDWLHLIFYLPFSLEFPTLVSRNWVRQPFIQFGSKNSGRRLFQFFHYCFLSFNSLIFKKPVFLHWKAAFYFFTESLVLLWESWLKSFVTESNFSSLASVKMRLLSKTVNINYLKGHSGWALFLLHLAKNNGYRTLRIFSKLVWPPSS